MTTPRYQIIEFTEQGRIPADKINAALVAAKVTPNGNAWRTFIDHLLLWLGGLALAFAVIFFIAYNWDDIGRFAKFGMVESFIVLAIVVYWKIGENNVAGKVALLVAIIFLGVLLALYGQTYQTGADPWQLFFTWALLMLPWALVGRFPVIWIVWITLINLSIILYFDIFRGVFGAMFGSDRNMYWILFLFNTLALILWELLVKRLPWLSEHWAIRLLAVGSGIPITWLVLLSIFDTRNSNVYPAVVWVIWLAGIYIVYRRIRPDLFMLAGICLSGIVVSVTFIARHMLETRPAAGYLFLALLVVGLSSGAAFWLKKVHKEWQS